MLGRLYRAVGGLKTLVACAGVFLIGLADFFDVVDLRPLLEHYVGSDRAGLIMMFSGVFFGAMRFFFTSGPAWGRRPRRDEYEGEGEDEDDGGRGRRYARVDDPDGYDIDKTRRRHGRGRYA